MGKYLLRRVLQVIPVVLGTTLLVYALVFALPGDPVKAMFGDKPVNPAVAAQIRAEYNLDKPFIVQYFIFLKNALTLSHILKSLLTLLPLCALLRWYVSFY